MTDRGLGVASMGKASRTKVESTRREKIAAQRAAERRAEKRRRIFLAGGSVVVVLAIVLVFVIVKLNSNDVYPNTPSFTFYKSSYTSSYLTFTPVELQTNIPDPNNAPPYTNLQTLTSDQQALLTKYDASPYTTQAGAVPFLDFGNKYVMIGTPFVPQVLDGLSWSTIATDLHNPSSAAAQAVDGTANYITAAICKMTGNTPASACTSTVQSLESQV